MLDIEVVLTSLMLRYNRVLSIFLTIALYA